MNGKNFAVLPKNKRITWTIQPEKEVLDLVNLLLGESPERGALTELINSAVRIHGKDATNRVIDEQIAALVAKKNGTNSLKSRTLEKAFRDSVDAVRKHQKV